MIREVIILLLLVCYVVHFRNQKKIPKADAYYWVYKNCREIINLITIIIPRFLSRLGVLFMYEYDLRKDCL